MEVRIYGFDDSTPLQEHAEGGHLGLHRDLVQSLFLLAPQTELVDVPAAEVVHGVDAVLRTPRDEEVGPVLVPLDRDVATLVGLRSRYSSCAVVSSTSSRSRGSSAVISDSPRIPNGKISERQQCVNSVHCLTCSPS